MSCVSRPSQLVVHDGASGHISCHEARHLEDAFSLTIVRKNESSKLPDARVASVRVLEHDRQPRLIPGFKANKLGRA